MYRLLAFHAVRKNLHDSRVMVLFAATLVGFALGGFISARSLQETTSYYRSLQQAASSQSNLDAAVIPRPVNELSFVHSAIDQDLPSYLVVSPGLVDYPAEDVAVRELSPATESLDWSFVLIYLLSIVCLILTFDVVSGEAERGTLRLLLVTGASRRHYFFGSLLGALLTVIPLLATGCLLNLMIVYVLAPIDLDLQDWGRVLSVFLVMLGLLVVFLALGLLASCLSRSSTSSLLNALVLWVTIVFVIPSLSFLIAHQVWPTPPISELKADLQQARERFFAQSYPLSSMDIRQISRRDDLSQQEKQARIASLQESIDEQNAFALDNYRKKIIEIREGYLNSLWSQVGWATAMARISPIAAYREVASAFTDSGLAGQQSFLRQARGYMATFSEYAHELRAKVEEQAMTQEVVIEDEGFTIRNLQGISYASADFDRRGYPRFAAADSSWADALQTAFPALVVLILTGSGIVMVAWLLFRRYEAL